MRKFKKFFIVVALMLSVAGIVEAKDCFFDSNFTITCPDGHQIVSGYTYWGPCKYLKEAQMNAAAMAADMSNC